MQTPQGRVLAAQKIEEIWSDRKTVAEKLFDLIFVEYAEDVNLDHDDQVRYALQIGVIAGNSTSAVEAVDRFYSLMEEQLS